MSDSAPLLEGVQNMKDTGMFDYGLCIEVIEHIPQAREDYVFTNLRKMIRKGLVLSWAFPGQGGKDHVNEQPEEYQRALLRRYGFYINDEKTSELRRHSTIFYVGRSVAYYDLK